MRDTFMYFAYGSNLLKKRIHINNPSAEFIGIGRLENHELDFIKYSPNWRGASATIVPKNNAHVWGAVWRVGTEHMPALDKQEGVDANWYFAKTIEIEMKDGQKVQCRTYQQTINPPPRNEGDPLPTDRLPSRTYLQCIIQGANEIQLPTYYLEILKNIPDNGQEAPEMVTLLKLN